MKVNANLSQNIEGLNTKSTNKSKLGKDLTDSVKSSAGGVQASTVQLSEKAQMMSKAKALATPNDGVDMDKVKRLQSLIDRGEYKVDAEALADKLVDEHLIS